MKAYDTYAEQDAKLTTLLANNQLVHTFDHNRYPLVLTIKPDKDPAAQMTMFSVDDGASSADASLEFRIASDGLRMRINGRLYIDEALMNKIKGLAKKLTTAYLFGFYAEQFAQNGDDIHYSHREDTEPQDGAEPPAEDSAETSEPDDFEGFFDDDQPEDAESDADEVTEADEPGEE